MEEQLWTRSRIGRVLRGDGLAMRRWRLATRLALGSLVTDWQLQSGLDEQQAADELGVRPSRFHSLRFGEAEWKLEELLRFATLVRRDPDGLLSDIIDRASAEGHRPPELDAPAEPPAR